MRQPAGAGDVRLGEVPSPTHARLVAMQDRRSPQGRFDPQRDRAEAGGLLLTHAVGPMRQYCIGAILLDLNDPSRVIGQTSEPILVPTGSQRVGYVPNVVYSCGGMIHAGNLALSYVLA